MTIPDYPQDSSMHTQTNKGATTQGTVSTLAQNLPLGGRGAPRLLYYYHPDYLGNVEYITDASGLPYQYFFYSPWGEPLKDQTGPNYANWDSPYQFNGKELDEETGLYYYGARYYNPQVSAWLSVDAMSHKYPNFSPYAFVANNPIMLTDPDGNEIKYAGEEDAQADKEYRNLVITEVERYDKKTQELRDEGKKWRADRREKRRHKNEFVQILEEIRQLDESEDVYRIRMGENMTSTSGGGNIRYNSKTGEIDLNIGTNGRFTKVQRLSHELKHAYQFEIGLLAFSAFYGVGTWLYDRTDEHAAYNRQNTIASISGGETVDNVGKYVMDSYTIKNGIFTSYKDFKNNDQFRGRVIRNQVIVSKRIRRRILN
jgi:RHS repeat-associated protein